MIPLSPQSRLGHGALCAWGRTGHEFNRQTALKNRVTDTAPMLTAIWVSGEAEYAYMFTRVLRIANPHMSAFYVRYWTLAV